MMNTLFLAFVCYGALIAVGGQDVPTTFTSSTYRGGSIMTEARLEPVTEPAGNTGLVNGNDGATSVSVDTVAVVAADSVTSPESESETSNGNGVDEEETHGPITIPETTSETVAEGVPADLNSTTTTMPTTEWTTTHKSGIITVKDSSVLMTISFTYLELALIGAIAAFMITIICTCCCK